MLLSHKNEGHDAVYSTMDGSGDYHTKSSQKGKKKYHMTSLVCGN